MSTFTLDTVLESWLSGAVIVLSKSYSGPIVLPLLALILMTKVNRRRVVESRDSIAPGG